MNPILDRAYRPVFWLVPCLVVLAGCGRSGSGDSPAANVASPPPGAPAAESSPAETPASTTDESIAPGEQAGCDAEPVKDAVGQPFTPELGEDVRVRSGSKVFRALKPGEVVTMEFRFDRVNLALDDQDVVTGVTCG